MAQRRPLALLAAIAITGLTQPAIGETCLEHFSCRLYGECRLPCFDDDAATREASTSLPAATNVVETQPSAVAPALRPTIVVHKPRPRHPTMVRVVASQAIRTLDDLAGKPVSFGLDGTRFQALGRRAFVAAGIKVQEVPLDLDNALDGVSTGDIAAVVVIGGGDARKIARLRTTDVHLLLMPAPDDKRNIAASPRAAVAETASRPILASAR